MDDHHISVHPRGAGKKDGLRTTLSPCELSCCELAGLSCDGLRPWAGRSVLAEVGPEEGELGERLFESYW
jgi:hypothetical protein